MYIGNLRFIFVGSVLLYIYKFFWYKWNFFFLEIYMKNLFKYLFFFNFLNKKGVMFNDELDINFLFEILMFR